MPTVQRTDLNNTSARVTVTLSKANLKPKLDAELKKFRNRAAIKGFRQGQAPMPYIRRMFGSSIFGETLNDMLSEALYNYLRESKLDILGQPLPSEKQKQYSFKIDSLEDEYSIEYEIGFVPPFELQGLTEEQSFERLTPSNLDELAETDLEYARKRMGKRTNPVDDIRENDILKIAAKELDGDQVKAEGWETTITVAVVDVTDENLKKDLLSKKHGDTLQFNARSLEKPSEEAKYRKYILSLPEGDDRVVGDHFEGTIEEVTRVEEAEVDEEFFKNYFGAGVNTREEAIETLKNGILRFYDVRTNALLMREFQTRLMELNPIDLPDTFLKRWLGVNNSGLGPEQIETEYPAFADNLRWSLVRDRLKEQFGIEISDEELRESYAQKVRNYFQADLPDHIIQSSVDRLMQDEKDVENTRRDLETDKVFQAIRSRVTITDKPTPSDEIHKILDAITKKSEEEQAADAALRETVE